MDKEIINNHVSTILECIEANKMEEALDYIEKLSPEEKAQWEIDNMTGLICSYCNEYEAAIGFYKNSLKKNPDCIDNYFNLADAYVKMGKYQQALVILKCCRHLAEDENIIEEINNIIKEVEEIINKNKQLAKDNNVLMIAYYYPPLAGSGVFRTLKYTKYLKEMYWNPTIITTDEPPVGWNYKDETLVKEIPDDIDIFSVPDYISSKRETGITREKAKEILNYLQLVLQHDKEAMGIFNELCRVKNGINFLLTFPCGCLCWSLDVIKYIEKNMDINKFDVIYTTSGPYSSHLVGFYMKKKYGIPWVADYRDPWTYNFYGKGYQKDDISSRLMYKLENILLKQADSNIVVANSLIPIYTKEFDVEFDRIESITNGYDEEDFIELGKCNKKTDRFTINYSGLLYSKHRNMDCIFNALKQLIDEEKIEKKKLCFRVVGEGNEKFNEEILNKYNLNDIYEQTGYVSHLEAIESNIDSDILLLMVGDNYLCAPMFTGKIFDYLRSGKKILAIAPKDGEVDNVLKETKQGETYISSQINEIKDMIYREYIDWIDRKENKIYISSSIKKFERKYLTMKLAECLYTVKDNPKKFVEIKEDVYDNMYCKGGPAGSYHKHYKGSIYYNAWKYALRSILFLNRRSKILEIGCGPGQFANMLLDNGFKNYKGFDYSEEGIKLAKKNNPKYADKFFVADAFETDVVEEKHDLVICFEVLEHIQNDLELLQRIPKGTKLLVSVPNFNDPYHVRYFNSEEEVLDRYKSEIEIFDIGKIMLSPVNCLYYIMGKKL